jgi:hypothetical protein
MQRNQYVLKTPLYYHLDTFFKSPDKLGNHPIPNTTLSLSQLLPVRALSIPSELGQIQLKDTSPH